MALELLAEFDPFLSNYLETYGNSGKGNTSCISYNICEQFISIISKQILYTIIQEVKASRSVLTLHQTYHISTSFRFVFDMSTIKGNLLKDFYVFFFRSNRT
jgi:hypothetical protein